MSRSCIKYKCLSIAGFDGSGGAGIHADLKTFSALGVYGMTVLTALPVQNTQGVRQCYELPLSCIHEQLEAIFEDIRPDVVKIGMLYSVSIIELVANYLSKHAIGIPIIVDPVMLAKSGDILLAPEAIKTLREKIIPLGTIVTPNLPEALALLDIQSSSLIAQNSDDYQTLLNELLNLGSQAVLLKGGHTVDRLATDYFAEAGTRKMFSSIRVDSKNTHGTGCTLSAAIAAYVARGYSLIQSCEFAKHYLYQSIDAAKHGSVGLGHGPVHHFHQLWPLLVHQESNNDRSSLI